jgi:DNA-directed RNA polymerase specialized sigma24 family protein
MTSENAIVAGYRGWAEAANQQLQSAGIDRAFLAAHLLTGGSEQAECAIVEAIASWGPDRSEDELFEQVLQAAVRNTVEDEQLLANQADLSGASLPSELQAVLRLAPQLRQCYVLRVLVGLPRQACATLLGLSLQRVDQYTCAALRCLPLLAQPAPARAEYAA